MIIHKLDWVRGPKGLVSLCYSEACRTVTVVSQDWDGVTCKNCIRIGKSRGHLQEVRK